MVASYVPILKWKQGEQRGLRDLAPHVADHVLPLVELVPAAEPREDDDEVVRKTIEEHLENLGSAVVKHWSTRPILVDLLHIDAGERTPDGRHPVAVAFERLRMAGAHAIPVTGPGRDPAYQDAVRQVVALDGRGACIRATALPLSDAQLGALLDSLNVKADNADLVLDVGEVTESNETWVGVAVETALQSLPQVERWRTLVLAAGAFPDQLEHRGEERFPRMDWNLYQAIGAEDVKRPVVFGDYAAEHPELKRALTFPAGSAHIRYTIGDEWVIVRGRTLYQKRVRGQAKDQLNRFEQFFDLARRVVESGYYCGPDFSKADEYISKCAQRECGTGNQTTWRQNATNHHVTFVVRQLGAIAS